MMMSWHPPAGDIIRDFRLQLDVHIQTASERVFHCLGSLLYGVDTPLPETLPKYTFIIDLGAICKRYNPDFDELPDRDDIVQYVSSQITYNSHRVKTLEINQSSAEVSLMLTRDDAGSFTLYCEPLKIDKINSFPRIFKYFLMWETCLKVLFEKSLRQLLYCEPKAPVADFISRHLDQDIVITHRSVTKSGDGHPAFEHLEILDHIYVSHLQRSIRDEMIARTKTLLDNMSPGIRAHEFKNGDDDGSYRYKFILHRLVPLEVSVSDLKVVVGSLP